MILEQHKWLLRSVDTCFDNVATGNGRFPCRICRVQEKGEVQVPWAEREQHLARHKREKIVKSHDEHPMFLEALDG